MDNNHPVWGEKQVPTDKTISLKGKFLLEYLVFINAKSKYRYH
jgi:hypothetical protein